MSSQAQIDANRRNAKKSTGPVSAGGKAACSRNALKSGIYASSHVIPGEDPAELEALTAAYFHQYQPPDPTQLALVDTLAATEWTQRRLRRIEAELWAFQIDSLDQNLTRAEFTDASFHHKSPLGRSYLNALEAFSRLQGALNPPTACTFAPSKLSRTFGKLRQSRPDNPLHHPPSLEVPRRATNLGVPLRATSLRVSVGVPPRATSPRVSLGVPPQAANGGLPGNLNRLFRQLALFRYLLVHPPEGPARLMKITNLHYKRAPCSSRTYPAGTRLIKTAQVALLRLASPHP